MKRFSPGASIHGDYSYICDCCEINDGRPVLIWEPLPERRGHFAICFQCLQNLDTKYNYQSEPQIIISRLIIPEKMRNEIFERDGYRCVKCGSTDNLELDHILPFSKGGRTEKTNLQTLCKICNSSKGSKEG